MFSDLDSRRQPARRALETRSRLSAIRTEARTHSHTLQASIQTFNFVLLVGGKQGELHDAAVKYEEMKKMELISTS
ncbi:hypothetical protein L2E82_28655 [Cichorium intybus]|uniref:Uncharacterized protein n=1 Tax=Cichorium intybus TaxID=13427 RepID=A0ACB9CWS1_CICIN|nr:hypothetical protein L2E82_28655 [Cichorium intybus]